MKKFIFLIALIGLFSVSYTDTFTDFQAELTGLSTSLSTTISENTYKNMGFYTGAGNVSPANTSGFLGLKAGLGIGVSLTPQFLAAINNPTSVMPNLSGGNSAIFNTIGQAISLLPMPYDFINVKLGVPVIPLDVGIRIGILPDIGSVLNSVVATVLPGSSLLTGAFHFGAEVRYNIIDLVLVKIDGRLSLDVDNGNIGINVVKTTPASVNNVVVGTNTATFNLKYAWSGYSIGAKVVAGVNVPLIGGAYGGVGLNLNFGKVTTTVGASGTLSVNGVGSQTISATGTKIKEYDPIDFRLMGGAQLLFINIAGEYGVLSQNIAVTIIPVYIVF